MTLPSALLGFLMAVGAGLAYHLLRGGSLRRMVLYVLVSCLAFFAGHSFGALLGWTSLRLGTLNLLPAFLAAILALVTTEILSGPRGRPARKKRGPPPRHR